MTSLRDELGHSVSLERLTALVPDLLFTDILELARHGFGPFYRWTMDHLALRGQEVGVDFNGQRDKGILVGISPTGSLLLKDGPEPARAIDAGSIYEW